MSDLKLEVILGTRHELAEALMELTPQEVAEFLVSSLRKVRHEMLVAGLEPPESDTELMRLLSKN